jgi:hypothetical protein
LDVHTRKPRRQVLRGAHGRCGPANQAAQRVGARAWEVHPQERTLEPIVVREACDPLGCDEKGA